MIDEANAWLYQCYTQRPNAFAAAVITYILASILHRIIRNAALYKIITSAFLLTAYALLILALPPYLWPAVLAAELLANGIRNYHVKKHPENPDHRNAINYRYALIHNELLFLASLAALYFLTIGK